MAAARRRSHTALWAAGGVAVIVVALIALLATSKKPEETVDSVLLGKVAPALAGTTLDGKAFSLDDYRGRFVLVNFFGSWCAPCVQEAPELRRWALEHKPANDAVLVNVVFNDTTPKVRAFFDLRGGYDWPVLTGNTDTLALDWGVSKAPETFLVTPTGYVVWKTIAPVTAAQLDRVLREGAVTAGATTTTTVAR